MSDQEHAYTPRGAVLYLALSSFLVLVGGIPLYIGGEETLTCARDEARRPQCRLTRRVAGVSVRERDLGEVVDAVLQQAGGSSRPGGRSTRTSYYVEYLSRAGVFAGQASDDANVHAELRAAVVSFVNDPGQDALARTLPAHSHWFAWVPLALGLALALLWLVGFLFPSTRSPVPGPRRSGRP
jgi:hypothetical protein